MKDPAPVISVITVCLNAEKHIGACLRSVAAQTYRHIEHVVIDGGSTDQTVRLIRAAGHVSTLVSEKDGGLYDAMNKGIARSEGDFLIFINADDWFATADSLASAVADMRRQPEGDVYYGALEVRKKDGSKHIHRPGPPEIAAETMVCGCLPHQSTLARRQVFDKTNGFDTAYRFHADHDWYFKVIHDPSIRLCQIDTVIGSFFDGGLSSQLEIAQPEVYRMQNASPLYMSPGWDKRRIELYQEAYLQERLEVARLRHELAKRKNAKPRSFATLKSFFSYK